MRPLAALVACSTIVLAVPAAAQDRPAHGEGHGGSDEHDLGNVIRDISNIPTDDPLETAQRAARVTQRHASGGLHREQILRALGNPETVTVPVTQELRRHAQRVAQLRRIRSLAEEAGRNDLVVRARRLLQTEARRHQARLRSLVGREVNLDPAPRDAR